MIRWFWMAFIRIMNRDRIPKLPRGMLATAYDDVKADERRVMARLGSRDIAGVRRAMRRYGVQTIDELVDLLEHQKPERNTRHRLNMAIGRMIGGHETDPHRADIIKALNRREFAKKGKIHAEVQNRVKNAVRALK